MARLAYTRCFVIFHRIHRAAAFVLLALLLSGCGALTGVGEPTPIPPGDTAYAGPPTVVTQATTVPTARPAFAFEPRQGGPGSTISVRGWGFAANALVKIGMGFPAYTGAPLGLTNANARVEWQVRVSMPDVQPSPGPDWSKTLLIVLDGNDRTLASAPFSFIFDTPPAPTNPVISFSPSEGTAGTTVSAFGSGYAPGTNVAIRLGLPNPMGEVLTVGNVDASGRWSATLVLRDRLPSGDSIPGGAIRLVAMNDRNVALASAPFTFHAVETSPVLGNSWQVSHSGDFNGDGLKETLTYWPAGVAPLDDFGDAALDSNAIIVSAVQVLQDGESGPFPLLSIDGSGVNASDGVIASFTSDIRPQGATAFRLAPSSGIGPLLYLLPLDENGHAFTQALRVGWDEHSHAYRIGQ